MDNKKQTPEEQLLSLIDNRKSMSGPKAAHKKSGLGLAGLKKALSRRKELLAGAIQQARKVKNYNPDKISLKHMTYALMVLSVLLSGYLLLVLALGRPDLRHIYKTAPRESGEKQQALVDSGGRTFLSYLAMVQRRNIFSPIVLEDAQALETEVQKALKQEIAGLIGVLRLAGISLTPEAQALIENKETKETFFLKESDSINGLRIDAIHGDRVVLTYKGEAVELF